MLAIIIRDGIKYAVLATGFVVLLSDALEMDTEQ